MFGTEHAGVVAGRPARAGDRVGEGNVEVAGLRGGDAHRHGLVAASAGAAELVELVLGGAELVLQLLALFIERGALGDEAGFLLGKIAERIGELGQVGSRHVLGGRREERGFHPVEHGILGLEHAAAVIEPAHLFLQATERVLEFLHAGVGREIDVGLPGGDVEDEGLGGALAADLERALVERLGEIGEDQFGDPAAQLEAGGAGDDGAVGVDGDGADGRIDRHGGGGGERGGGEESEGNKERFHGREKEGHEPINGRRGGILGRPKIPRLLALRRFMVGGGL